MPAWRHVRRAPVCIPLLAAVTGCSTPGWLCVLPPGPSRVSLVAAPDANTGQAVAVDLLFVADRLAVQKIGALSASDYFQQRTQLQRDFGDAVQVRSWGLAPGQLVRDAPTNSSCNRLGTFVFARYTSAGEHRQVIQPDGSITIDLGAEEFKVTP